MSYVQTGSARESRGGVPGWAFAVIAVIVILAAAAYFLVAGSYGGNAPSNPYQSAAPASGAPGNVPTSAPSAPSYP